MSEALQKIAPNKLAIFGNAAINDKFSGGIKGGEFLPKISIKGRSFALVVAGERKVLPSPHDRSMDVIFVDAREALSKEWYEVKWGDKEGTEKKAPDCTSADAVTPDADARNKQSDTCQLCPHNAWGSAEKGKGKACADYKLVVVLPAHMINLPDEKRQPFTLRLPAMTLKAFKVYERSLTQHGIPLQGAVTTLTFADGEFPQLEFGFKDVLQSEEEYNRVLASAERQDVKDALRSNPSKKEETHASQQPVIIKPVAEAAEKAATPAKRGRKKTVIAELPAVSPEPVADAASSSEIEDVLAGWLNG